jgi:hypothetical protein
MSPITIHKGLDGSGHLEGTSNPTSLATRLALMGSTPEYMFQAPPLLRGEQKLKDQKG